MTENRDFDLHVLKKSLKHNNQVSLQIVSDSMEPLIKVGESIEVAKVQSVKELRVFDIILFDQAGRLNCHFLAKVDYENNVFITKSLRHPGVSDYPIGSDQIIGIIKQKRINWWLKIKLIFMM